MKTILFFLLPFLLVACTCTKNAEKQLPPATQTGANTFGCKINGVPYVVTGKMQNPGGPISTSGILYVISSSPNEVYISTKDINSRQVKITFPYTEEILKPGVYTEGLSFAYYTNYTTTLMPGKESKITVTRYDTEVLSGTFELYFVYKFQGPPYGQQDYIITEGRFDISLKHE